MYENDIVLQCHWIRFTSSVCIYNFSTIIHSQTIILYSLKAL